MVKKYYLFLILIALSLIVTQVSALDTEREDRLEFGYVIWTENVFTSPENILPGEEGTLFLTIKNNAIYPIYEVRMQIDLPTGISVFDDVSKRKLTKINSGESITFQYNILISPSFEEGIYEGEYNITYVNHIGTERSETDTFGIKIKGTPHLFAQIDETAIYENQKSGEVTLRFINDDLSDIKFLTITLQKSPDYDVISNSKQYIGDLDSDDYETLDFKLTINNNDREIKMPMIAKYKDIFNNQYEEEIEVELVIKTAEEAGIQSGGTIYYLIVLVLILGICYFIYRRYWKKKQE